MADYNRVRRIGELIQREIALMLQREIKDPRVKRISITAVKMNRDLSVAKVYFTLLETQESAEHDALLLDSQLGIEKASGFIRHKIGQKLELRIVPKLHFLYDKAIIHGANMSRLIDEVIAKDEANKNTTL